MERVVQDDARSGCVVRPKREVSASSWRSRLVREVLAEEVLAEDGENIAVKHKESFSHRVTDADRMFFCTCDGCCQILIASLNFEQQRMAERLVLPFKGAFYQSK